MLCRRAGTRVIRSSSACDCRGIFTAIWRLSLAERVPCEAGRRDATSQPVSPVCQVRNKPDRHVHARSPRAGRLARASSRRMCRTPDGVCGRSGGGSSGCCGWPPGQVPQETSRADTSLSARTPGPKHVCSSAPAASGGILALGRGSGGGRGRGPLAPAWMACIASRQAPHERRACRHHDDAAQCQ